MKIDFKNTLQTGVQNPFVIHLLLGLILSVIIVGLQQTQLLQGLELRIFDQRLGKNTDTAIDNRIVIIGETEPDIHRYGHPIPDQVFADALQRVEKAGAKVIGVDKYRDIPVAPGTDALKNVLAQYDNIIWVFFAGNSKQDVIIAPEPLTHNPERTGFSNIDKDPDGVVRRGLLFLDVEDSRYYSFPLLIALHYLMAENRTIAIDEQGHLKLDGVSIPKVDANFGAYNGMAIDGYQVMLEYPGFPDSFRFFTLSDLFDGKIPEAALRDKIVLFGATAPSLQDFWLLPKEKTGFGIEYHGYLTSQLLNIANKSPLQACSNAVEYCWLLLWCLIGVATGFHKTGIVRFFIFITLQSAMLLGGHLLLLSEGWWLPFVAPSLGWISGLFLSVLIKSNHLMERLASSHEMLEKHVEKTNELQEAHRSMENANQELVRLASTDGLTQLANRRCFDEKLAEEWHRHHREQQPLAVILGDVDFFKRFNDHYGHPAGDECLRQVASCYNKVVTRSGDLAARYGGEEFVVILPNTNAQNAATLAEKLLNAMRAMKLPHELSDASEFVSISLGVASLIPSSANPDILLEKADQALYMAKEQGRNRYCIHH